MDTHSNTNPDLSDQKPMARVVRIPLFHRQVRETLNLTAVEILLAGARKLSEGQLAHPQKAVPRYYGSTMLTIDLRQARPYVRNPLDAATAVRLAQRCNTEPILVFALKRIAQAEAERLAGGPLASVEIEVKARARKEQVLVDLDVEATIRQQQVNARSGHQIR